MNILVIRVLQIVSIPLLYAFAYCLDLWRLSASYDVSAMRLSTATFFAMSFPQIIFICGILLVGYTTVLRQPSIWVSLLYFVVGGYVALLPSLLMNAYANHSEMTFIPSVVAFTSLKLASSSPNSLFAISSAAILSIGLLAFYTSLYALYKRKTA